MMLEVGYILKISDIYIYIYMYIYIDIYILVYADII